MGLVQYESSDEDEDVSTDAPLQDPAISPRNEPNATPTNTSLGPAIGPVMGPALPPTAADVDMSFLDDSPAPAPRSPYSATRALLRDLTLPAVPNMDMPRSPPRSPVADSLDALNAKFDNFLALKRGKGLHFNERLAASNSLRNPALMDKLLGFVGVETVFADGDVDQAVEQYATTLAPDVFDPAAFPEWAYKGPLRRAQDKGHKERERGRGEPVEFTPAAAAAAVVSAEGSRPGTPGAGGGSVPAMGKRKTRFDA
ncbi:HCNGP-like protein-domain-containing protein [Podospora appendiculata]|uniref:HCNGP-like protein-domain-containing protein n=1 Tax=Podospora appendiculata TaxID=314037 RepID=A0AAE0WY74_9PEZI|nr:HCNGP-like protein-domain-containing protein [Podospora appendiculata]KAK3694121.1 HCNGP-like protein-domain-containing protein [Podospora appendiculata]